MKARILLAEDDRALSALILDFFHAAGLEVHPVYDGAEALAAAAEHSFDLIILDVMMPHYDGLEVCRRIRRESSVPVLFLTALGQEENALEGYRAGADDYLTKPFSFPVLVAKAQAILRRSRGECLGEHQLGYGSNCTGHRAKNGLCGWTARPLTTQGAEYFGTPPPGAGTDGKPGPPHPERVGRGL